LCDVVESGFARVKDVEKSVPQRIEDGNENVRNEISENMLNLQRIVFFLLSDHFRSYYMKMIHSLLKLSIK